MDESISIALATFNGANYLPSLLASLAGQSRRPFQLIASDDASEDGSVGILEAFAESAPFAVTVLRNNDRLGVAGNFSRAIAACKGGIIALADQDDVWRGHKIRELAAAMAPEGALAAFSDAAVVDENLQRLGYTMWQQSGFSLGRQRLMLADRSWEVLFKDPVVTGATLMFRSELLPLVLPIPDGWVHDAWIAQIAASQGRLVPVANPLVLYRQHGDNVIGGRKRSFGDQVRRARTLGRVGLLDREIGRYSALRDRLVMFSPTTRRNVMLAMCDAKLGHLERRRGLPARRAFRISTVFLEWISGHYMRFAKDWRNIAADLLMP